MTLTKGQGHRSRSNVQKLAKIYTMGHISDAILPTDFILGTKVQPNKAHSKMGKKTKKWSYLRGCISYRLHTWYQDITQ